MEPDKWYIVHYTYGNSQWGFKIQGSSFEDAEARLRRAGLYGKIDGEHVMTIPDLPGAGIFVRLITWWRNTVRKV